MSGESWETTSGLLDDYVMSFEEAWFAKPANYRDGKQTVLQVRGVAVDPEDEDEVLDDEKETFYSLGDGWEPDDGGESASHGSGKTKFNENSSMGKLIRATVGLGDDVIEELKSRGETFNASTWRGLRFRFERTEFTFKDRKTGEENTYAVDLPVEFLGIDEDADSDNKKKAARKTAAKTGKPAAKDADAPSTKRRRRKKADDDSDEGADSALRDSVIAFAAEWEDHSDFMEAVLDPDEFDEAEAVQNDEEILNDILDEDGEIWQASRAVEPA